VEDTVFIGPFASLPIWGVALVIYCSRIVDVSCGTLRTISVVHGRVRLAVVLGFFELTVWVVAVSQVIIGIREHPLLVLAYAAGYASGNGMGIYLERKLAIGTAVVRIISDQRVQRIAEELKHVGRVLTTFDGTGLDGPRKLLYATVPRRDLTRVIARAQQIDPELFYSVDRFAQTGQVAPVVNPTGWRAVLKKK